MNFFRRFFFERYLAQAGPQPTHSQVNRQDTPWCRCSSEHSHTLAWHPTETKRKFNHYNGNTGHLSLRQQESIPLPEKHPRGYRKIIISTMPHLFFQGYSDHPEHQEGQLNGQPLNRNVSHRSRVSQNNSSSCTLAEISDSYQHSLLVHLREHLKLQISRASLEPSSNQTDSRSRTDEQTSIQLTKTSQLISASSPTSIAD